MKLQTAKRLHDAAEACREIEGFSASMTREDFLADRTMQLAFWKLIEVTGEALHQAERLDPSLPDHIDDFRDVVNTRNRIVHGYDSVDFALLWEIATGDIPQIRQLLDNVPIVDIAE